jgi:hypothetical protein
MTFHRLTVLVAFPDTTIIIPRRTNDLCMVPVTTSTHRGRDSFLLIIVAEAVALLKASTIA